MVRIDDRGRHLRRDVGRGLGQIDGEGGGQRPRPLAIATEAIPTRHDAELLLGGLEGLRVGDALPLAEQPRGSGTHIWARCRDWTSHEEPTEGLRPPMPRLRRRQDPVAAARRSAPCSGISRRRVRCGFKLRSRAATARRFIGCDWPAHTNPGRGSPTPVGSRFSTRARESSRVDLPDCYARS